MPYSLDDEQFTIYLFSIDVGIDLSTVVEVEVLVGGTSSRMISSVEIFRLLYQNAAPAIIGNITSMKNTALIPGTSFLVGIGLDLYVEIGAFN